MYAHKERSSFEFFEAKDGLSPVYFFFFRLITKRHNWKKKMKKNEQQVRKLQYMNRAGLCDCVLCNVIVITFRFFFENELNGMRKKCRRTLKI